MSQSIYQESFLPLSFFLHTVFVNCFSCQKKALITTDIPLVVNQEKITYLFNDCGTISYAPIYKWQHARFLCFFCKKHLDVYENTSLEIWYGPVIGIAETLCSNCEVYGYKEYLSARKEFPSKKNLPKEIALTCPKCHTINKVKWCFYPRFDLLHDPILGLKLFAITRVKNFMLWAYNPEHLHHIQKYIEAKQRKRIFNIGSAGQGDKIPRKEVMSFSDYLPKAIKSSSNRIAVLKTIDVLKKQMTLE